MEELANVSDADLRVMAEKLITLRRDYGSSVSYEEITGRWSWEKDEHLWDRMHALGLC